VGVRPEDLHLAEPGAPGSFAATIETVEPVGNEIFVHLQAAAQTLIARVAPRTLPAVGEPIGLQLAPGRLHCFDPVDERRLDT